MASTQRPKFSLRRSVAVLALLSTLGSGCYLSPRGAAVLGNVAAAAIYTAAIVGTLAMLSDHDGHYHFETCGHYRRWHSGRWVYNYQERWEYYDDYNGQWYYYD